VSPTDGAALAGDTLGSLLFFMPMTQHQLLTMVAPPLLVTAPLGGVPRCRGAGGMAGHVRFGAHTRRAVLQRAPKGA
jgi:cytochrome c oxidase assembly factor CtaG